MELLRSHSSFLYVLPAPSWTQVIRWPLDYDIISSIKQCDILHKNRFISRIQNWLLTCRYVPSKWSFHSHFPFRISHVAFIVRYCWLEGWRFQWNWQWHVPFANSSTGNHGSTLFFCGRIRFISRLLTWNYTPACVLTRAVDSAISGFMTSKPIKSDCSCISNLFDVIPPSTCTFCGGIPQSFLIASRMSRTWKQTASNDARRMWPRCVSSVIPQITLRTNRLIRKPPTFA